MHHVYTCIWVFPKIMVSPNHSLKNRVFHYKPSILGLLYPIFGNTHLSRHIAIWSEKWWSESVPLRKWNPSWEALQEITPEKAGCIARLRENPPGKRHLSCFIHVETLMSLGCYIIYVSTHVLIRIQWNRRDRCTTQFCLMLR